MGQRFIQFFSFLKNLYKDTVEGPLTTQAAALSYSTLMALGPMIAVGIMASSFLLKDHSEETVTNLLLDTISFIAPSTSQYTAIDGSSHTLNPQLIDFIQNVVTKARSGTLGVVGGLALLLVALLQIVSIENALNSIWKLKRGRPWADRLVIYWTTLTLGGLLALSAGALGVLGNFTQTLTNEYGNYIPIFLEKNAIKIFTYTLIALLLYGFYKLMPHTKVNNLPALGGSLFAAGLLYVNNKLSFLYVSKVVQSESLYGSIGIIPVLMFGLYVFWFLILLGGQLSYHLQVYSKQKNA